MAPKLTDVFVVREGTSTGGATDVGLGSAKFRALYTDPDLEDVDTHTQELELYGEATGGDKAGLKPYGTLALKRLSNFPWKKSPQVIMAGETRYLKKMPGYDEDGMPLNNKIFCFVTVVPAEEHARTVGRGNSATKGWMLDCEIRTDSERTGQPVLWFLHVERRYPTEAAAMEACTDVMDFVDARSLSQLMDVPRSGPLQMTAWRDGEM